MTTRKQTPLELAVDQVADQDAAVDRWKTERDEKQRELVDLEARFGQEVLADESAGDRLSATRQQLRDRIRVAQEAADAARAKALGARRAAVLAEASECQSKADEARDALEVHERQVAGVLQQLRDLEGVPDGVLAVRLQRDGSYSPPFATTTARLRTELARTELKVRILREVAAGRDPGAELAAVRSVVDGLVFGEPDGFYFGVCGRVLEETRRARAERALDDDRRAMIERQRLERQRPSVEAVLEQERRSFDAFMAEQQRQDSLAGR